LDLEFAIEAFLFYPQLFTTPEFERTWPRSVIRFERVLEEQQVVYFWLPALEESIAVREIGKLVLFNVISAAKARQDDNKEKRQMYVFIDEFQRIVGESLQIILEQARSYGVGVVLSNHNAAQLKTAGGRNLWPLIHGNTAATLHFGTPDRDELKMLSDLSGERWREFDRAVTATRSCGRSQSWRDLSEQAGVSDARGAFTLALA
jgi:type IV secretory pathway TraG/TraD family ATPase VirD4